ncbi:MAG: endonuclease/exonuclease/phosphatase family protein [Hyphomicrobiales bacterium]|nr:endonuclease/exonuclease/phosphatase family protein [Hyphomicrobiales bacterium]
MRSKLRIISWNLLHRSGALVGDISALIEKHQPDLFLMQEVTGAIEPLSASVGGQYYTQSWPGRRHGLGVWSRMPLQDPRALELPSSKLPGKLPTRFAQVLEIADITIANVHLSHGQILNRRQLRLIARSTDGPTAIIGDYNSIGPVVLRGFSDVGPRGSTHHAQEIVPFRLDRCMVRKLHCSNARTLLRGPSDHRPILLDFRYPGDVRPQEHYQSTSQITV